MSSPPVWRLDRHTPPHFVTIFAIGGIASLNQSMFLPSLNTIAEAFGTSFARMQGVVALYLVATAVMQLILGPLADRFGRRPVILGTFAIFIGATIAISFAQTAEAFMALRIVQASVASGIVLSRAMIRDIWDGPKATAMLGYMGVSIAIIVMLAPTLGGLLSLWFGWRAIFVALTMMGLAVFTLAWLDQGETAKQKGGSFKAQLRQWPIFLSSKTFWLFAAAAGFAQGSYTALLAGTSFIAEGIFGLNAAQGGLALGFPAVSYALGAWILGRISARISLAGLILLGNSISGFGVLLALSAALLGASSPFTFYGGLMFLGIGHGLSLPATQSGMMGIKPELSGTASGLGGAIGFGMAAAISAFAGSLLGAGATEVTLLVPMLIVTLCSFACGFALKPRA